MVYRADTNPHGEASAKKRKQEAQDREANVLKRRQDEERAIAERMIKQAEARQREEAVLSKRRVEEELVARGKMQQEPVTIVLTDSDDEENGLSDPAQNITRPAVGSVWELAGLQGQEEQLGGLQRSDFNGQECTVTPTQDVPLGSVRVRTRAVWGTARLIVQVSELKPKQRVEGQCANRSSPAVCQVTNDSNACDSAPASQARASAHTLRKSNSNEWVQQGDHLKTCSQLNRTESQQLSDDLDVPREVARQLLDRGIMGCASPRSGSAVELVIDERERGTEAVPRELRNAIEAEVVGLGQRYRADISTAIETIPISDFIWRSGGGGIANVLVERKAIKDIVGRSVKDDQTRQLERMSFTNPDGSNVLLIDGDVCEVATAKAYGHNERSSVWDPDVRYFDAATFGEMGTAIRTPDDLLVYIAALITNGSIKVAMFGDSTLAKMMAGYTLYVADKFDQQWGGDRRFQPGECRCEVKAEAARLQPPTHGQSQERAKDARFMGFGAL